MTNFRPNDEQVWRTVPLKLLPLTEQNYTTNWAKRYYSYRHLFDKSVTAQCYSSDIEVEEWRLQALQLMKEIKHIGIAYGRKEIVNLARNHYGMTMPNAPLCKPTNVEDVMSIVEDEEWYNDNRSLKHNIIYHLIYGLTRSGMNGWLITQERKWMREHNIQYDTDEVGVRKTKLRGFVYSIMNSKFSNSTTKLFRTVMKRKYQEFITVRKPLYKSTSNYVYTEKNFLGGNGYVVTCVDTTRDPEDINNTDAVESIGIKWIQACKREDMSLTHIHDMLDELYNIDNKDGKNDELCLTNDKDVMTESDTESTSHDNEVPQKHLKEPRVNLIHWNQITPDRVSGKNKYHYNFVW